LLAQYRTIVMAAAAALALIVVLVIVAAVVRRRRRARALLAPLPLIPFSTARGAPRPARPDGMLPPSRAAFAEFVSAPTPAWTPPVQGASVEGPGRSSYAPPYHMPTAGRQGETESGPSSNALADTARPNDMVSGAAVDGASVRYWRPADGTLQFLPGRLEVIAGRDAGQEIRFVRTPGPDGTRVTFGRAEGAPYRHVQLREPTVSRTHACMTLDARTPAPAGGDGRAASNGTSETPRWRLENLSATNPVVVNGRPLAADESPASFAVLGEGDRIEMGEVVFRFHEK
jgi:hypothetical protein